MSFSPEVIKQDGQARVAKTAGQAGVAGAVITVGQWVAQQVGWSGELPSEVVAGLTVLLTSVAAWLTNLGRLRGES